MSESYDWVWETKDGRVVAVHVEYDDAFFKNYPSCNRTKMEKQNKKDIAKFCSDAIKENCIPKRLPHKEASTLLRKELERQSAERKKSPTEAA